MAALESDRREAGPPSGEAAGPPGLPVGPAIAPLNITGLVITKADLVAALRIYVPQLAEITALDEDRFLLSLAAPRQAQGA